MKLLYTILRPAAVLLMSAIALAATARYQMLDDTLRRSDIYPGTVHTFRVAVPDDYNPSRPAALYVGLDGILCHAPEVIDSLTACGIMPVTISVYLQPGYVPAADGTVARYNRSNEFDATDARFATFLETELLPAVEKIVTSDGRPLRLSPDPADRMIFGLSSGGIAAFNAAWQRPDLFSKVFSGCGTFVPMRGGNDIEAIVRKHEPLPLRIFLQDGYTDTWNPIFGSWYEHNRMLASALEFAGYDCAFDWAEGGHSVARSSQIFPEVMKWMWRPDSAATATTGNGLLASLLIPGETWQPTTVPAEIPALGSATYPDGSLTAKAENCGKWLTQYLTAPDGSAVCGQRFYWLHSTDNMPAAPAGMAFDGDGYLWVATASGIQICDQNGRVRGILRLPKGLAPARTAIIISEGSVTLTDGVGALTRRFNVNAPIPGQRPASQGAA